MVESKAASRQTIVLKDQSQDKSNVLKNVKDTPKFVEMRPDYQNNNQERILTTESGEDNAAILF